MTNSHSNSTTSKSRYQPNTSPSRQRTIRQFVPSPRQYFTRQFTSPISTNDLPLEKGAVGIITPYGLFFFTIKLTVPIAYIYIFLILLRESCTASPNYIHYYLKYYMPPLAQFVDTKMKTSSNWFVEIWVVVESVFYICQRLHIRWLQYKDPLEASLAAAPMLTLEERDALWTQMMDQICCTHDCNHNHNHDNKGEQYNPPLDFIRGWFFNINTIQDITKYDVLDFIVWSMFEGRNQEHLTREETEQLDNFMDELEWRISLYIHGHDNNQHPIISSLSASSSSSSSSSTPCCSSPTGTATTNNITANTTTTTPSDASQQHRPNISSSIHSNYAIVEESYEHSPSSRQRELLFRDKILVTNHDYFDNQHHGRYDHHWPMDYFMNNDNDNNMNNHTASNSTTTQLHIQSNYIWNVDPDKRIKPNKLFRFQETTHDESPSFFTNLYENYQRTYKQYRHKFAENVAESMNLNLSTITDDIRNFVIEKRQQLHEAEEHAMAAASNMYENAYFTLIDKGSDFDKRLSAITSATHNQVHQTWNSVWKMKERLETATFISRRKAVLQQQLKGYRLLLGKMRSMSMSNTVPTRNMADLMRKITQCIQSLNAIEHSAMNAFLNVTGVAGKHLLPRKDPQRYAKYSNDPLLGVATYPLMFHLIILALTDGLLRVLMKRRGFTRLNIGETTYYYHPGSMEVEFDDDDDDDDDMPNKNDTVPFVFCHGIGIGLAYYLPLIDELLKHGRPILLPEIPYVTGFRPWLSPHSILTPAAVVSTLTAMLASHGHLKATFLGHSYGTSWLSYMCKYAPDALASVIFIDPICFCLHHPCLTKAFVYHRADPGSVSFIIKTDIIINWTIQRSFPWSRIILFAEDIPDIPCSIFLSDKDVLIPALTVENYLKSKGGDVCNFEDATKDHFEKSPFNITVFRGDGHGDWTERSDTSPKIAAAALILTTMHENRKNSYSNS